MTIDMILAGLFLVVFLGLIVMKTHSAFVVLALCAGSVLVANIGQAASTGVKNLQGSISLPLDSFVQLAMILAPGVPIALYFRDSQKSASKLITQIAPSVGVVALITVFIADYLPYGARDSLRNSSVWSLFQTYKTWIVLFAVGVSLITIMFENHGGEKEDK